MAEYSEGTALRYSYAISEHDRHPPSFELATCTVNFRATATGS